MAYHPPETSATGLTSPGPRQTVIRSDTTFEEAVMLGQRLETAVQAAGGLESTAGAAITVPCKVAALVFEDAQRRFKVYSNLRLALVLLGLAGIVAGIVLFIAVDDAAAAAVVTFIEGLVAGALAKPVSDERDQARTDRDAAVKIITEQCNGQSSESIVGAMG
jgi:hypothetical protein